MMRPLRRVAGVGALVLVGALLITGARFVDLDGILSDRLMGPPADACPRLDISAQRCAAIVDRAIVSSGIPTDEVVAIELGRPATRSTLGGDRLVALVRLHMGDGRSVDQDVWCDAMATDPDPVCGDP